MVTIKTGPQLEWRRWAAAVVLLALTVVPVAAQAQKPLIVEGQLKKTDPFDRLRQQSHHRVHEVELTKDQVYLIELRSVDFDTFLRLEDGQGKKLGENDDISKDDLNSRLGFAPSATAKYRLIVTSFEGKQTGKYVLRLLALQPVGEAQTVTGKLTKDSAKVQGRYTQVHKVQVQPGRWYVLDLISKEFDPYLILRDGQGKVLAQDDDSGGDLNARLLWHSEKGGAWQVQALAFKPGSTGTYTLRLRPYEAAKTKLTERERLAQQARDLGLQAKDLYDAGKFAEAVVALQQGVALLEKLHPQGHPDLAGSLTNLGIVLNARGQPAKALPYFERALAMYDRLYPKQDRPDLAESLTTLGNVLYALDQPARALPHYERALAMCERLFPKEDHAALANSLTNLGLVLMKLGQPAKALPHRERALAMRERLYPKQDHPELVSSLRYLGVVLNDLGQPARALPYAERAVAMSARLYPKQDHPDLARSLNSLGIVLSNLGQSARGLPYFERAVAMNERLYPKQDHPELANTLSFLGNALNRLLQPAQALPHLERALAMYERLYPKQDHPELANSLSFLGGSLNRLQQPAKALPYCERSLAMYERLFPKQDRSDLARSLLTMGAVLSDLGLSAQALPYFERALAMYERLYPRQDHPALARSLNNLGSALDDLGRPAQALPHLERAWKMYRSLGEQAYLDETQALAYAATWLSTRDGYLSLTRDLPGPESVYLHLWSSKAAITRIVQERHAAVRIGLSKSPEHKAAWDELVLVRSQLTFWLLNANTAAAERDQQVRQLTKRKEELERQLGKAFPERPRRQELDKLGVQDLAKRLPDRTAFIDLIHYRHYAKGKVHPHYVAFVLTSQGKVQRVELGPAKSIDLAVDLWRQAVSGWSPTLKADAQRQLEDRAQKQAAELRRLVWEPLAKQLVGDTHTVYLAPDGNLARFAFAALPGRKPGTILLQELAIAYVPHGPGLLERLVYPPQFPKGPGNALLVGGVNFGHANGKAADPWPDLKATLQETRELQTLAGKRPVLTLTGREASTTRLKQELPKFRYAHLATHGFFKEDEFIQEKKRQSDQLKRYQYLEGQTTDLVGQGAQSPLVFTGLVLAGANAPAKTGTEGGFLVGEVIVDLPLQGMQLAVLSACETGLGELTGGEGVRNLQLAFHLAGCPDVVASLWQVNDRATAVLMAKFYHELWVKDRPPLEALRQAQLLVYQRPDLVAELGGDDRGPPKVHADRRREVLEQGVQAPLAKGIEGKLPLRTPTKLWAAFVLSGTGQ